MGDGGLYIAVVLLLVLANGVFALAEIAIVSSRKTRLQQMAQDGKAGAQVALELASAPDRFLSTVQVGITLIGILNGAFGGAELSKYLAPLLEKVPALKPYSSDLAFGLIVAAITYLSLVVGELVPKRVGLSNPEGIACALSRPMRLLARIVSPFVTFLSGSGNLIMRILPVKQGAEPPVSAEEIKIMVEQGAAAGVFKQTEKEIVHRVFKFGSVPVSAIMTHASDIVWLNLKDPPEENWRKIAGSPHSYFPVYDGDRTKVLGLVPVKKLWAEASLGTGAGARPEIRDCLMQPLYVPGTMPAVKLLETFKTSRKHIAMVVDEFGTPQGLVTTNDVLEAIVGDMPPEEESAAESDVIQREDGSFLLDGMLPIDKVKETLNLKRLPEEDSGKYHTLGGFMMMSIGRMPKTGDHFQCGELRFEIVDMDGLRVDKVLVAPAAAKGG